jgi:hypothetical protein
MTFVPVFTNGIPALSWAIIVFGIVAFIASTIIATKLQVRLILFAGIFAIIVSIFSAPAPYLSEKAHQRVDQREQLFAQLSEHYGEHITLSGRNFSFSMRVAAPVSYPVTVPGYEDCSVYGDNNVYTVFCDIDGSGQGQEI